MAALGRRLAAEAVGTAFLLAAVVGSGVMATRLTQDVALALLANAVATGAALVVLITGFGPISGAHFNPAVTLAFGVAGRLGRGVTAVRIGVAYVVAQILGAVAGVWAAHIMFAEAVLQVSATTRAGPAQGFAEAVATFGLVLFIFLAVRFREDAVAWVVGLYITAAYWFTASTSFANPAVTVARTLTDTFAGVRPFDAPAFIIAQFLGALAAAAFARWLAPDPQTPVAVAADGP